MEILFMSWLKTALGMVYYIHFLVLSRPGSKVGENVETTHDSLK